MGHYEIKLTRNTIEIQGQLGWAKQKQMTPLNLIILRMVMFTFGRFFPNLIRTLLQKMLILGRKPTPFTFNRTFQWLPNEAQWQIIDELKAPDWDSVRSMGIGCDQTSIYVVMSRTFQKGQLQPWLDLNHHLKTLQPGQILTVKRNL